MAEHKSVGERLARLETKIKGIEDDIEDESDDIKAIMSKLEKIDKELSRYRGVVGGVLFVATALVTFVKLFKDQLHDLFTK